MKIQWLGHSCFLMTTNEGTRILTDPFDETVGYEVPAVEADIVTSSHDHFDHNYFRAVKGDFTIVDGPGKQTVRTIEMEGIATYHDEQQGKLRGTNIMYVFTIDGMRICHCGDLGHQLPQKEVEAVGKIDILMVPVGDVFTIDAMGAKKVVDAINPTIVIPMHYKTPDMTFDIQGVEPFLTAMNGWKVEKEGNTIKIDDAGEKRIVVMDYKTR